MIAQWRGSAASPSPRRGDPAPHRLGFERRNPKGQPARADPAGQEAFVAEYERLLNRLGADEIVYFADAVHPEHQSRPAHAWIRRGDCVAVPRGKRRQRVNLAGALRLESFDCQLVEVVRITTESTIALIAKPDRASPGQRLIPVILDRAGVIAGGAPRRLASPNRPRRP